MTVLCVIQARVGSTRLPGKVLQDLGGRPMLRFMLDRVARANVDMLVVATSTLERDDAVAQVAADAGCAVVRGSETDVLARFVDALDAFPADDVVRLTADCPLTDPTLVDRVVANHHLASADYTSNVFPRTFPKGLDVEVMTAAALRTAATEARAPAEREHVTPFLYRHPERFRLANVRHDTWLGNERWTVDTAEDLAFVRELVAAMGRDDFAWTDALAAVGERYAPSPGRVELVPAALEHCTFVLDCRHDEAAIRFSASGRAIDPDEHQRWYRRAIDDPGTRLRIARVDGVPVGTVRVDVEAARGEVGIAIAPPRRGQGLGTAVLGALLADIAEDPQVDELWASIHPENVASLRAFQAVGFVVVGEQNGFRRLCWRPQMPIEAS